MTISWLKVCGLAACGALLGFWLLRLAMPNEPLNAWGLLSFTSLGACLGCLLADHSGGFNRF